MPHTDPSPWNGPAYWHNLSSEATWAGTAVCPPHPFSGSSVVNEPSAFSWEQDTWTNMGIFQSALRLSMMSDPAHDVCTESAYAPVLCLWLFCCTEHGYDIWSSRCHLETQELGSYCRMTEQEAKREFLRISWHRATSPAVDCLPPILREIHTSNLFKAFLF